MTRKKKIAVYGCVALGYLYIYWDGGRLGHILAIGGIATSILFLLLRRSFSKAADKAEKRSKSEGSSLES